MVISTVTLQLANSNHQPEILPLSGNALFSDWSISVNLPLGKPSRVTASFMQKLLCRYQATVRVSHQCSLCQLPFSSSRLLHQHTGRSFLFPSCSLTVILLLSVARGTRSTVSCWAGWQARSRWRCSLSWRNSSSLASWASPSSPSQRTRLLGSLKSELPLKSNSLRCVFVSFVFVFVLFWLRSKSPLL